MKRIIVVTIAVGLALGGVAFGADIGNLTWDQSNIQTLRSFDKAAIFEFITGGDHDPGFTEKNIWEFGWYDLAGDGKYELALEGSTRPCCVYLTLYWQDAPGKVRSESFEQGGELKKTIRDLNGDGKYELIISKLVVDNGGGAEIYWRAVYRLENGKYVEASRDFPAFYDNEELPDIEKQSAAIREPLHRLIDWCTKEQVEWQVGR